MLRSAKGVSDQAVVAHLKSAHVLEEYSFRMRGTTLWTTVDGAFGLLSRESSLSGTRRAAAT